MIKQTCPKCQGQMTIERCDIDLQPELVCLQCGLRQYFRQIEKHKPDKHRISKKGYIK